MTNLKGKVALVTGASRGIGKGIALALGEQGCTVYITGRTTGKGDLTINTTATQVDEAGGIGKAIQCDHGDDKQIAAVLQTIEEECGHLDILVNNVYKIPSPPAFSGGFWEHPISIWDDQVGIGLRSHYVASWHAAKLLFAATSEAAIVNISSPGGLQYAYSSSYGAGKAGLDRLTADMAIELKPKGVTAISLYPGMVSTEFQVAFAEAQGLNLSEAQTPLFVGRCLSALLQSGTAMDRTGSIQWVHALGEEFSVLDENGRRPNQGMPGS